MKDDIPLTMETRRGEKVRVGTVTDVRISDGSTRIEAEIHPDYAGLLTPNLTADRYTMEPEWHDSKITEATLMALAKRPDDA